MLVVCVASMGFPPDSPAVALRSHFRGGHRAAAAAVALLSVALLAGCGRKAKEADCQVIIDRLIELEMKASKEDSAAREKKRQELLQSMKDERKGCVGKRISDGMITCVQRANSSEEVVGCIR